MRTGWQRILGTPPEIDPDDRSTDRRLAAALFGIALIIRIVAAIQVQVIAPDGVRYIAMARHFAAGQFTAGLAEDYHPLYPMMIALFRPVLGGFESGALGVSVVFSSLAVLPLFAFFRSLFSRRAALAAAAVFVVLPHFVRAGADTISEGLFHFLILSSLWAGAEGFRRKGLFFLTLGGVAAGAAYCTRLEGLGIVLAFGMFTTILMAAGFPGSTRVRAALFGLLYFFAFLAAASPYLVNIRLASGTWDLSRKKTASNFSGTLEEKVERGEEVLHPHVQKYSPLQAMVVLGDSVAANFYYVPGLLALIGLFWPWRRASHHRPWRREVLAGSASGVWVLACMSLLLANGYLSHRHTIPIALFLLGHAGRGAVLLSRGVGTLLEKIPGWGRFPGPPKGATAFYAFLLAFAFVAGCPENFRPFRRDKAYVKTLAAEVVSWPEAGTLITGNMSRVSYYSGRRHLPLPLGATPSSILALAKTSGSSLLVVKFDDLEAWAPSLFDALSDPEGPPPSLRLIKEWKTGRKGRLLVRAYAMEGP